MAGISSYYKFTMDINCKGGGYRESHSLLVLPPNFASALPVIINIAYLRGRLLEPGSRIANMVLSVETEAGSNPAEGFELAKASAGVPELMKNPVTNVLEVTMPPTSDPALCIVLSFDTASGRAPIRTLRSLRSTWIANNGLTVGNVVPLGPGAANPSIASGNTPAVYLSNFFSYIRDNTSDVQITPAGPSPFNQLPFAAQGTNTPPGPDFALIGLGKRKIGKGWPRTRGRKPAFA